MSFRRQSHLDSEAASPSSGRLTLRQIAQIGMEAPPKRAKSGPRPYEIALETKELTDMLNTLYEKKEGADVASVEVYLNKEEIKSVRWEFNPCNGWNTTHSNWLKMNGAASAAIFFHDTRAKSSVRLQDCVWSLCRNSNIIDQNGLAEFNARPEENQRVAAITFKTDDGAEHSVNIFRLDNNKCEFNLFTFEERMEIGEGSYGTPIFTTSPVRKYKEDFDAVRGPFQMQTIELATDEEHLPPYDGNVEEATVFRDGDGSEE